MVKGTLFANSELNKLKKCDIAFVIGLKGNDDGTQVQIMNLGGEGMIAEGVRKCLADCIVHIVEHLSGEDDPYKAIMHLMRFKDEVTKKAKERTLELVGKAALEWEEK